MPEAEGNRRMPEGGADMELYDRAGYERAVFDIRRIRNGENAAHPWPKSFF